MDDAYAMRAGEGVGHVQGDLDRALYGQPPVFFQQVPQRAAEDVLHHQVVASTLLDRIDHLDDVVVIQLAQGFSLADEACDGIGGAGHDFLPEDLDRHELSRTQIGAPIHVAHPAPTEQVTFRVGDLESSSDNLASAHHSLSLSPRCLKGNLSVLL